MLLVASMEHVTYLNIKQPSVNAIQSILPFKVSFDWVDGQRGGNMNPVKMSPKDL